MIKEIFQHSWEKVAGPKSSLVADAEYVAGAAVVVVATVALSRTGISRKALSGVVSMASSLPKLLLTAERAGSQAAASISEASGEVAGLLKSPAARTTGAELGKLRALAAGPSHDLMGVPSLVPELSRPAVWSKPSRLEYSLLTNTDGKVALSGNGSRQISSDMQARIHLADNGYRQVFLPDGRRILSLPQDPTSFAIVSKNGLYGDISMVGSDTATPPGIHNQYFPKMGGYGSKEIPFSLKEDGTFSFRNGQVTIQDGTMRRQLQWNGTPTGQEIWHRSGDYTREWAHDNPVWHPDSGRTTYLHSEERKIVTADGDLFMQSQLGSANVTPAGLVRIEGVSPAAAEKIKDGIEFSIPHSVSVDGPSGAKLLGTSTGERQIVDLSNGDRISADSRGGFIISQASDGSFLQMTRVRTALRTPGAIRDVHQPLIRFIQPDGSMPIDEGAQRTLHYFSQHPEVLRLLPHLRRSLPDMPALSGAGASESSAVSRI
jgi:hypothetical protein